MRVPLISRQISHARVIKGMRGRFEHLNQDIDHQSNIFTIRVARIGSAGNDY